MGTDRIHRWESGLPTQENSRIVPWYVEPVPTLLDGADARAETGPAPVPGDGGAVGVAEAVRSGRTIPTPRRSGAGPRSADDVHGQIKGFASTGAVAPGEAIDFRITVNPPQQYGVDIYRIGHYGGDGAAKITSSPRLSGIVQPAPLTAERTVSCHHWWLSWRLQVPADWTAGAYVAVLTTADGHRSHIPFTVRAVAPTEGRGAGAVGPAPLADLLLVLPDLTWQAYNVYPEDGLTGASLHHAWDERGRLLGEDAAAVTVSFDRPYAGTGLPLHIGQAYDFIRWAERYGYDLEYADARDLHAGRVDPSRYRGVVFPGPDEYWSEPMRRAAEDARDSGTSLVFLSAGALYWQAELTSSPSGDPDRLLSCRKRRGPGRPATWRDAGEPEQLLLGIQYAGRVPEPRPLVVRNAGQWLWEGTGCAEGDELPGLVAAEADRYYPRTPLPEHARRILLSHSPYEDAAGVVRHQETSLYRAPSGALVFAAGTAAWCAALDRPGHADERIQRATANLLDRICKRS